MIINLYKAKVRRHSASKISLSNKEKKLPVSRIMEYRTKKKLFNDIKDDESWIKSRLDRDDSEVYSLVGDEEVE